MADVNPEICIHRLRDLIEDLVVNRARIADGGVDDEPRPHAFCMRAHLAPLDLLGGGIDAVVLERIGEAYDVILFAHIKGEDTVARLQEGVEHDARSGGDVAEADDRVIGAEQLHRTAAHDAGEMQPSARRLVVPVKDAVRQYAALEILRIRRHRVHIRQERERIALALAFLLQQSIDLGVKCLQMICNFFSFHEQLSFCTFGQKIS